MKYDFDKVIDRHNTNSSKWDMNETLFGSDDVLDMWVADMDFPCPQPVLDALKQRLEHPIFGYTFPSESLYEAIIDHLDKTYGWKVKKEWIVFVPTVVEGFNAAVKALTHPGDEVILQPPVYYPFGSGIANNGCVPLENPLKLEDGRYSMDFEHLESLFELRTTFPARTPRAKAMIFCSPHNPVGRVWSKEELKRLGEICIKNGCTIISDEIHCDLLFDGAEHTPTATISPEFEQNIVTFMSVSKTFNLAGLKAAFGIIPNDQLRADFTTARAGYSTPNVLGLVALESALRDGKEYLEQLREYLQGNMEYFKSYIEEKIPQLKMVEPEGTYLAWVDMRGLGLEREELSRFMIEKARTAVDYGYVFGTGGDGFNRFNLACPRSILEEALQRLEKAVKELV